MTDKALEAALKACPFCGGKFVAQGASKDMISVWCSCGAEGPKVPFPEINPEPIVAIHECIRLWNRRAPLSALPGEAEVVELVEKMRRGTPEKQVGIGRHGDRIIDVDLAATDALLLKAADVLQAMQARAEKAEIENDRLIADAQAAWSKHGGTEIALGQWKARAEAAERERDAFRDMADGYGKLDAELAIAEGRVKELEEALEPFAQIAEDETMMDADSNDEDEWFRWDGSVLTVGDFRRARTALKGGSNG